jgi:L-ascorbate metabolism protein UlaG (beta-lactamase superfamily)
MATSVNFLGHGAFLIRTGGKSVLIDPFLTGNPLAAMTADQVEADYIIVSHGHGDHVGDTVEIAERTNAMVIANFEIAKWLSNQGVKNTHGMNTGGSHRVDCCTVKLTQAHHGSMMPDGSYGGCANGILLKTPDGTLYHACDTALFSDMRLIGDEGLEIAILPIGDNYTMGPEDSLKAIEFLRPKVVIPGHYNTFPVIHQDANAWAAEVRRQGISIPAVLNPGESYTLN